jgi:hypothetical protein
MCVEEGKKPRRREFHLIYRHRLRDLNQYNSNTSQPAKNCCESRYEGDEGW